MPTELQPKPEKAARPSVAQTVRRKIHTLQQPDLVGSLVRGAGATFLVQGGGQILTIVLQIVLARTMGREQFGMYTWVMSWVATLAVVAGLGFPVATVRFLPEYQTREDWPRYWGIVRWCQNWTLAAGLSMAAAGTGVLFWMNHAHPLSYLWPFVVGLWTIPLTAQTTLLSQMSRAMRRVALAYGPPKIGQPLLLMVGVFVLYKASTATSVPVLMVSAGALLASMLFQTYLLRRDLRAKTGTVDAVYEPSLWSRVAFPLLLMNGCVMIFSQADILTVGHYLGPKAVAVYGVVNRMVTIINFALGATNFALGPEAAALYAKGDISSLQRGVSATVQMTFWPALAATLGLVLLGKPLLVHVFGQAYGAGYAPLCLLALGSLVNISAGPVLLLLNMTGNQMVNLKVCAIAVLMYLVLLRLLVPSPLGFTGAALASMLSQVLWNVWLCVLVKKRLNINTFIFTALLSGRRARRQ